MQAKYFHHGGNNQLNNHDFTIGQLLSSIEEALFNRPVLIVGLRLTAVYLAVFVILQFALSVAIISLCTSKADRLKAKEFGDLYQAPQFEEK